MKFSTLLSSLKSDKSSSPSSSSHSNSPLPSLHTPLPFQASQHLNSSQTTFSRQTTEEETCPICGESLDMKLKGEKHIVPNCGHRLRKY